MKETPMKFIKKLYANKKMNYLMKEWVEPIIIAVILALIIRTFVVQAFKIPTGSMRPTLMEGDRLLVNKFIYKFKKPERGDVIVFISPEDRKKDFIKRLVALQGEDVEISNGTIFIDGRAVDSDSIMKERYYYNRGEFGKEGEVLKVPVDSYYVLGDNSISSRDSRYWGFLSKKDLIGKAFLIYWPPTRFRLIK